jgi:hypothetical protein
MCAIDLRSPHGRGRADDFRGLTVLKLFLRDERLILSEFMPILENPGLRVIEVTPYHVHGEGLPHFMIYSFAVQAPEGGSLSLQRSPALVRLDPRGAARRDSQRRAQHPDPARGAALARGGRAAYLRATTSSRSACRPQPSFHHPRAGPQPRGRPADLRALPGALRSGARGTESRERGTAAERNEEKGAFPTASAARRPTRCAARSAGRCRGSPRWRTTGRCAGCSR